MKDRKFTLQDHYSFRDKGTIIYPSLRIQGKWLADAGFKPSDKVVIKVSPKKLTLKLITD